MELGLDPEKTRNRASTVVGLIAVAMLLPFVVAGLWLTWTLAYSALGRQAAVLTTVTLLVGTFAVSRAVVRTRTLPPEDQEAGSGATLTPAYRGEGQAAS